jgi:response regulator RpfG family c-di-GMP phosphodiesterase
MMGQAQILVVEDDYLIGAYIQDTLEKFNYSVSTVVPTGEEAVDYAVNHSPDLILMDIHLAGKIDGIEAARQIHEKQDYPIVYLSAHSDAGVLDRAKITEPLGFIVKPFQEQDLNTTIEMALYKHKSEMALRESQQKVEELNHLLEQRVLERTSELETANQDLKKQIKERHEAENKVRMQLKRLQSLRAIDTAINGSMDLELVLTVIIDQIRDLLHPDAVRIFRINQSLQSLDLLIEDGIPQSISRIKLSVGDSLTGKVANRGAKLYLDHLQDRVGNPDSESEQISKGFSIYAGVPVVSRGQVMGVLEILYKSKPPQDADWLEFIETLAGQTAIAIDKADLFNNLLRTNHELIQSYDQTIRALSSALDLRDHETEGHSMRVTEMSEKLGKVFNLSEAELAQLRRGALLHDIGKLGIPDSILLKEGPLNDEEWKIMKRHPDMAFKMLSPINYLRPALDIPYNHHEKWDGSGYPRGLEGEQIPFAARIFAIVDVWDALSNDRPYRKKWSKEAVSSYLSEQSGTHFDPKVVEVFLELIQ